MNDKAPVRSRAEVVMSASQVRDNLVKSEIAKERASTDAKTARLKALRLAREAELEAEKAKLPPAPAAKIRRARAKKPAA